MSLWPPGKTAAAAAAAAAAATAVAAHAHKITRSASLQKGEECRLLLLFFPSSRFPFGRRPSGYTSGSRRKQRGRGMLCGGEGRKADAWNAIGMGRGEAGSKEGMSLCQERKRDAAEREPNTHHHHHHHSSPFSRPWLLLPRGMANESL